MPVGYRESYETINRISFRNDDGCYRWRFYRRSFLPMKQIKENYAILRGMILEIEPDHRAARGKKRDQPSARRVIVRMNEIIERAAMVKKDMESLCEKEP
jgi:hypothetical protein